MFEKKIFYGHFKILDNSEVSIQCFSTKAQKKSELLTTHSIYVFQPKISVSRISFSVYHKYIIICHTAGLSNHIAVIIRAEARCCMSTVVQTHTCIHNVTVHLTYTCQSRNPNAFACNYAGSQGTQGNPLFMPVLDCTDMIE